ncbi:DUF6702 family protein [Lacinutrix sp. MedPE-SW]|uniref:DUF6702 family protein n=1 Tax=Lacinutrix sp. MedPE-SW TaxID=1860087 RepID=UPI00091586A6|nr:DUF6702 family protein [Lacinutrix sp. MedPE-SW]OIQ21504.1 MAG: peptidase E [Lacinutrix sp. MedPE-SW]
MKFLKIILAVALISSLAFTAVHKYYVSITKIEYVKEKKSVQIITRIFIDDFERLLRERYDDTIILASNQDETQIDRYIEKYVLSRFKISINGKLVSVQFIGKEYDEDVVQCYLEVENIEAIKSFEIENKILFDVFSDQKNIVRTHINGKHKSFILIPEKHKGMLNF